MTTLNPDIVGYAAAAVGTFIMLPQLIKSLRTKSVKDLSIVMIIMLLANHVLWVAYGILINRFPVSLSNGVAFMIVITLFIVKIKYAKR